MTANLDTDHFKMMMKMIISYDGRERHVEQEIVIIDAHTVVVRVHSQSLDDDQHQSCQPNVVLAVRCDAQ